MQVIRDHFPPDTLRHCSMISDDALSDYGGRLAASSDPDRHIWYIMSCSICYPEI